MGRAPHAVQLLCHRPATVALLAAGLPVPVAAAAEATYVDVYGPSIGHDACQLPGTRWVEPLVPLLAAPVDPNALGMQAMAAALLAAMAG